MFNSNAQCYQHISQVLLTSAFILWPTCTRGFGIREKIRCGLRFFGVFLCGFAVFGPPLRPPPHTIIDCLLFHIISWACLTSNKLQTYLTLIICKLFMDIRLTQNSIATNKCSFIQSCTWDFFFGIFLYKT